MASRSSRTFRQRKVKQEARASSPGSSSCLAPGGCELPLPPVGVRQRSGTEQVLGALQRKRTAASSLLLLPCLQLTVPARQSFSWLQLEIEEPIKLTGGTQATAGTGSQEGRSTKTKRSIAWLSIPDSLQKRTRNSLQ